MDVIENIEEMAEQKVVIYFGSNKQATHGSPYCIDNLWRLGGESSAIASKPSSLRTKCHCCC
jgi:hypothetical protein